MRFLIAPDKFKGTLTQFEAAAAIREGAQRAADQHGVAVDFDECAVADGGEGTLDVLAPALGLRERTDDVRGPLGDVVHARWGIASERDGARDAVIESAHACGLRLLEPTRRDPSRASSFGVGQLIAKAREARASRIIVALGGSATVDGGMGMAAALGFTFHDAQGRTLDPIPSSLERLEHIAPPSGTIISTLPRILALCDVASPLLGPDGAARVYGPQKGASAQQVEELERGLDRLVRLCGKSGLHADPDAPGAGAAGGLGFGLAAFLGAERAPGASFILDTLSFDARAAAADLVITGEGSMDLQTTQGKACFVVAQRAASFASSGVPCIAVVGRVEGDPAELQRAFAHAGARFTTIRPTGGEPDASTSPAERRMSAARALAGASFDALSWWLARRGA